MAKKQKDQKNKGSFGKRLFPLALGAMMIAAPLALAGCSAGKDGLNGADGAKWHYGVEDPASSLGKLGDFYFETDDGDVWTKLADGWSIISNIKGPQGEQGAGKGITSVEKTGTDGLIDTYTITFTDGTTTTFTVTNGKGVASVVKTGTEGLVDTYTITFTDGTTTTFTITNGATGADGSTWLNGTAVSKEDLTTFNGGKVGDYYINTTTYDVFKKETSGWVWQCNIKGAQGEAGQDGASVYVGYDGYIWEGATKTTFKLENQEVVDNDVFENTLGIEGTMSKYFDNGYIDLSTNQVALMSHYKQNANLTLYSGLTINEISVYAESAGTLQIGTAKVSDIVANRTEGTTYTASTTSYSVVKGLNTITLDLAVAEDETIVLGGNNSVGLYYAQGIDQNDEQGVYTITDNTSHTEVLSQRDGIKDKLALQVKVGSATEIGEVALFENVITDAGSVSALTAGTMSAAPFTHVNAASQMSGKTITKIGYPVKSVKSFASEPFFTVSVVEMKDNWTTDRKGTIVNTIKVNIPLSAFSQTSNTTVNEWIYVDVNIQLTENQVLGFGASDDTAIMGYKSSPIRENEYGFTWNFDTNTSGSNASLTHSLFVDLYYQGTISSDITIKEQLEKINKIEDEAAIDAILAGKTLSILGDSISTYEGYSNSGERNTTNATSETKTNSVYYGSMNNSIEVNDTWWKQTIDQYNMELLVNNSWGGSRVTNDNNSQWGSGYAGYDTRCVNLHDNTTSNNEGNAIINPDIIAVYIGINDIGAGISVGTKTLNEDFFNSIEALVDGTDPISEPTTFEEGYAIMIYKMVKTYSTSDIFVFNMPITSNSNNLTTYNAVIEAIAEYYNLPIVDLYGSDLDTTYTSDNLHPTAAGMDIMTEVFVNTMKDYYLNK